MDEWEHAADNSYKCWLLAISELRKKRLEELAMMEDEAVTYGELPETLFGKSDKKLIRAAIALTKLRMERRAFKVNEGDEIFVSQEDMQRAQCVFEAIGL